MQGESVLVGRTDSHRDSDTSDKDRVSDDSSDESDDQRFEHEQHHLCLEEEESDVMS
jgi:hypothetical protein